MTKTIIGRAFFVVASGAIIVMAGGPSFLQRPVGVAYLGLWTLWWIVTPLGRQRGVRSDYDRSQRPVMTLGVVALVVLIVVPPWESTHSPMPLPHTGLLPYAGLALLTAGIALQSAAMWALRAFYTTRLGRQPGHYVVRKGPYRFVRHPGYLSYMISLAGIGLALGSLAALIMAVSIVPFLAWRINREEEMLLTEFGEEYGAFMKGTRWRLVPFVY